MRKSGSPGMKRAPSQSSPIKPAAASRDERNEAVVALGTSTRLALVFTVPATHSELQSFLAAFHESAVCDGGE